MHSCSHIETELYYVGGDVKSTVGVAWSKWSAAASHWFSFFPSECVSVYLTFLQGICICNPVMRGVGSRRAPFLIPSLVTHWKRSNQGNCRI